MTKRFHANLPTIISLPSTNPASTSSRDTLSEESVDIRYKIIHLIFFPLNYFFPLRPEFVSFSKVLKQDILYTKLYKLIKI